MLSKESPLLQKVRDVLRIDEEEGDKAKAEIRGIDLNKISPSIAYSQPVRTDLLKQDAGKSSSSEQLSTEQRNGWNRLDQKMLEKKDGTESSSIEVYPPDKGNLKRLRGEKNKDRDGKTTVDLFLRAKKTIARDREMVHRAGVLNIPYSNADRDGDVDIGPMTSGLNRAQRNVKNAENLVREQSSLSDKIKLAASRIHAGQQILAKIRNGNPDENIIGAKKGISDAIFVTPKGIQIFIGSRITDKPEPDATYDWTEIASKEVDITVEEPSGTGLRRLVRGLLGARVPVVGDIKITGPQGEIYTSRVTDPEKVAKELMMYSRAVKGMEDSVIKLQNLSEQDPVSYEETLNQLLSATKKS